MRKKQKKQKTHCSKCKTEGELYLDDLINREPPLIRYSCPVCSHTWVTNLLGD